MVNFQRVEALVCLVIMFNKQVLLIYYFKDIPPEIFRYYLLINRPEKSDSLFTWKDFGDKNNNELLPNLGNLINRTLKFSYEKFDQAVPSDVNVIDRDVDFIKLFLNKFTNEYLVAFENVEIKNALKIANELSATVNKYL